ncbi:uncharacterized protein LOC111243808 [Varroa destructor]|uniref:Uncharacterized protein n=1 Tax=Varroa destructor TaxID=109461 RepID=A0A7M7J1V9_VARDE|nr:uncharacterized protein LOC111243808 [Varroa destructor]
MPKVTNGHRSLSPRRQAERSSPYKMSSPFCHRVSFVVFNKVLLEVLTILCIAASQAKNDKISEYPSLFHTTGRITSVNMRTFIVFVILCIAASQAKNDKTSVLKG